MNEGAKKESADFILRYSRPDHLDLLFLGPFRNPVGRLEIRGVRSRFVDDSGRLSPPHPILNDWSKAGWAQEMDFIFGIVGTRSAPFVQQDSNGKPVRWSKKFRTIDCNRSEMSPDFCVLQSKDLRAEIVFSSVDCSDSL